MPRVALALAALVLAGPALGKPLRYALPEDSTELRPAKHPGFEATQNNCMSCHSGDYILTQPPKSGPGFWQAEVTKMIKVYHAPVDDADAKTIAEYLAQTY